MLVAIAQLIARHFLIAKHFWIYETFLGLPQTALSGGFLQHARRLNSTDQNLGINQWIKLARVISRVCTEQSWKARAVLLADRDPWGNFALDLSLFFSHWATHCQGIGNSRRPSTTWYDMTWYAMICHDMLWHDMKWYDMTWYDMPWDDMIHVPLKLSRMGYCIETKSFCHSGTFL